MHEEPLEDYPMQGQRTISWLYTFVREHGGTFDSRHTRWMLEQKIEKDSMPARVHDMVGLALEMGLCYDQVDPSNLVSFEVMGRLYQLIEETGGSLCIEGLEHYVGRDASSGLRRGIALAPSLAKHATDAQAKETAILKERRKAKEEKDAVRTGGKPGQHKK